MCVLCVWMCGCGGVGVGMFEGLSMYFSVFSDTEKCHRDEGIRGDSWTGLTKAKKVNVNMALPNPSSWC